MTYSIVALDRSTGELGVAVQTRWYGVGRMVPWVEPGVGAVATQSFTEPSYGPGVLSILRAGVAPTEALDRLLAADDRREVRQVGVVAATGATAAHTGARCVEAAGHVMGDGVSCQANMMSKPTVPRAMLEAFEGATGDLADRLMGALLAAEAEGGDIRGRQSAALLVAPGNGPREPWRRRFDIRVDDAVAPLEELARLLRLSRAEFAMDLGDAWVATGDIPGSIAAYEEALRLAPDDDQVLFTLAMREMAGGRVEAGRAHGLRAIAVNPDWPEFIRRMVAAGHIPPEALQGLAALE